MAYARCFKITCCRMCIFTCKSLYRAQRGLPRWRVASSCSSAGHRSRFLSVFELLYCMCLARKQTSAPQLLWLPWAFCDYRWNGANFGHGFVSESSLGMRQQDTINPNIQFHERETFKIVAATRRLWYRQSTSRCHNAACMPGKADVVVRVESVCGVFDITVLRSYHEDDFRNSKTDT